MKNVTRNLQLVFLQLKTLCFCSGIMIRIKNNFMYSECNKRLFKSGNILFGSVQPHKLPMKLGGAEQKQIHFYCSLTTGNYIIF